MRRRYAMITLPFIFIFGLYPIQSALSQQTKNAEMKDAQIRVCDATINAFTIVENYLISSNIDSLRAAIAELLKADSIYETALKPHPELVDTAKLQFIDGINNVWDCGIDSLHLRITSGDKIRGYVRDQIVLLSKDGAIPFYTFMAIIKVDAEKLRDELQRIYFVKTWAIKSGKFKMSAYLDNSWNRKFDNIGLADQFIAVRIQMKNKTNKDITFNTMGEKFIVITDDGKQYENVSIMDFGVDEMTALDKLKTEDQQMIFKGMKTVYRDAETPLIVLFPKAANYNPNWRKIVFDTAIERPECLPKGELTK